MSHDFALTDEHDINQYSHVTSFSLRRSSSSLAFNVSASLIRDSRFSSGVRLTSPAILEPREIILFPVKSSAAAPSTNHSLVKFYGYYPAKKPPSCEQRRNRLYARAPANNEKPLYAGAPAKNKENGSDMVMVTVVVCLVSCLPCICNVAGSSLHFFEYAL